MITKSLNKIYLCSLSDQSGKQAWTTVISRVLLFQELYDGHGLCQEGAVLQNQRGHLTHGVLGLVLVLELLTPIRHKVNRPVLVIHALQVEGYPDPPRAGAPPVGVQHRL